METVLPPSSGDDESFAPLPPIIYNLQPTACHCAPLNQLQAMLERNRSKYTMEATKSTFLRVTDTIVGNGVENQAPLLG